MSLEAQRQGATKQTVYEIYSVQLSLRRRVWTWERATMRLSLTSPVMPFQLRGKEEVVGEKDGVTRGGRGGQGVRAALSGEGEGGNFRHSPPTSLPPSFPK